MSAPISTKTIGRSNFPFLRKRRSSDSSERKFSITLEAVEGHDHLGLAVEHDRDRLVGVIEKAKIKDRQGRATVRFGNSAFAEEVFRDVVDGLRPNVSVSYRIHEAKLIEESDEGDTVKVTRWEPIEISLVATPADITIGVGRERTIQLEAEGSRAMPEEKKPNPSPAPATPEAVVAVAPAVDHEKLRREERARVADLTQIGQDFGQADKVAKWIADDASVADARGEVMAEIKTGGFQAVGKPMPSTEIGLTPKEVKRFSFLRALNAIANPPAQAQTAVIGVVVVLKTVVGDDDRRVRL